MRIIPFILFFAVSNLSAQIFLIQKGDEVILHNNVDNAFGDLEEGDELYLPGGTYNLDNFFGFPCDADGHLPDNVKIFGAGHYPEHTLVTGKTILTGEIGYCNGFPRIGVLYLGLNNIITGVDFDFGIVLRNNASVSYCNLSSIGVGFVSNIGPPSITNVYVANNIINSENILHKHGYAYGSVFGRTGTVTKNIIGGCISTLDGQINFDSNIFIDTTYYDIVISGMEIDLINGMNASFQNNIFVTEYTNSASLNHDPSLTYTNNLFVGPSIGGTVMPGTWAHEFNSNNTFFQDKNTLFENYIWGAPFDYGFDFHLPAGHVGIGADTNGENIGIFKTDDETENKIPFNPHFISKMIPAESDGNGMLNIQIQVEARQN